MVRVLSLSLTLFACGVLAKFDPNLVRLLGGQAINLWKLEAARDAQLQEQSFGRDGFQDQTQSQIALMEDNDEAQINTEDLPLPRFKGYWFRQPLDHFANSTHTWRQRYWINTRYYQPNTSAPVIVLDGGETSGEDRLPFLDTGIVEILAKATGGVGVVLEHRWVTRCHRVLTLYIDLCTYRYYGL